MNVKIIDKNTHETYCGGEIIKSFTLHNTDGSIPLISMDGTYYFKMNGGSNYDVIESESNDRIPFDEESFIKGGNVLINPFEKNICLERFDFVLIPREEVNGDVLETPFEQSFILESELLLKYEVIDNRTNEVVVRGGVVSKKTMHCDDNGYTKCDLISFDFKNYFWSNGNDRYTVRKAVNSNINVEYKDCHNYKTVLWKSQWDEVLKGDVIREYSIDECDPEIQGLVYALNKIPDVRTTLSCCGHDISQAWVLIMVDDIKGYYRLIDILRSKTRKHSERFYINLSTKKCPGSEGIGDIGETECKKQIYSQFILQTYKRGKKAYQALKDLENHINEVYGQNEVKRYDKKLF